MGDNMSIKHLRAKLHGIKVTGSELNYHGSITLDPVHCNIITIYPLEFVEIWNKNNGERFSTYVIYGEENSNCCVLNGSAARKCQLGDELIIAAYEFNECSVLTQIFPKILTFNSDNSISEILEYRVAIENNKYSFFINKL